MIPFESVAMTTNDIVNGRWKSAATRIARDGLHAAGEIGDMFSYVTFAPLAVLKAGAGLGVPNWLSDPVSNLLTNPIEDALDKTGAINPKDTYDVNKDGQIDRSLRFMYSLQTIAKSLNIPQSKVLSEMKKMVPVRRLGKPEEYGYLISFLASNKAAYINGTAIPIDGGLLKSI